MIQLVRIHTIYHLLSTPVTKLTGKSANEEDVHRTSERESERYKEFS
jgi:hypothetical protein